MLLRACWDTAGRFMMRRLPIHRISAEQQYNQLQLTLSTDMRALLSA